MTESSARSHLRLVADNTAALSDESAPVLGRPEGEFTILVDATRVVVGEVSKVYQSMKQAVEGGSGIDLLGAARAFDELPAWQRERIRELALEHATAQAI